MTFLLICLGALTFVLGGVMNWAMLAWQNSLPPLLLIALLLLLGVQELILHAYWFNPVGWLTQFYYLPLLRAGVLLTNWTRVIEELDVGV